MKKIIITIILFILVIGGSVGVWYWQYSLNKKQKVENEKKIEELQREVNELTKVTKEKDVEEETTQVIPAIPAAADWKTYNNTQFGFKLTFPESWKGYKAKVEQEKYIYFELPTSDPNFADSNTTQDAGYVSMFAISAYPIAEWNAIPDEEKQMEGPIIGQTATHVYTWGQSQAGSEDTNPRRDDSKNIIDTFELI